MTPAKKPRKVFVTPPGIAAEAQRILIDAGCSVATADSAAAGDPELLTRQILDHAPEGLIVRAGKVTSEAVAVPSLRVISKHGIGVENIDVEAATGRGIPVFFTPGANARTVAEHALALIFALARGIPQENARVRAGKWDKGAYTGLELAGKTLGIVGFGRIGGGLARLAAALDMKVLAYDPYAADSGPGAAVTMVGDLRELLSTSDFVSLHCPLRHENRGMLGAEEFALMRPQAYLVNTARGGLVDEKALVDALRTGSIAGAALDTFAEEPPDPGNPLLSMENVIVTPHVAGSSPRSLAAMGAMAAENVLSVLEGTGVDASRLVNPEVMKAK